MRTLPALSSERLLALRRELENQMTAPTDDEGLHRRLLSVGIVSEIKPSVHDSPAYRNRKAVSIQGKPLSETVIRERR